MILENLLNILAINLHKFFKNTRIMAENLRSPNTFFFGFIAKRLMLVGNQKVIEDSVKRLNIKSEDKILEVGSGNGQALIEILKKNLKKIKVIDILVNNAGTNIPEPFEKIKQQSMNYLVDLNLKAAFNVAQLVVKKMIKNKKRAGSIINMSSQLGHVGMSGRNIYNMTKFGIEGLTKGMGVELATKNIRVNTVAPTFVETPMVKKFFKNKKFKQLALSNIPMGKVATESDVATAVCFLASDAASMITGTSIVIDGGWTAK